MAARKQWQVKCKIQKGMFENEYLVAIDVLGDQGELGQATAFADKDDLTADVFPTTGEPVAGWLAVSPLQIGRSSARIVLPKPTMANGAIVMVPTSNLATPT